MQSLNAQSTAHVCDMRISESLIVGISSSTQGGT